jgi:hypothetical protein
MEIKMKKFLILVTVILVLSIPVAALKINDPANRDYQIGSTKPVANNMNINLDSNKNFIGKLNVANAKKYIITSNPKNGRLSIDQNGKFSYTPKKNFVGKDSFKYKVNNGKIDSNIATVSITVTNNHPVSNNLKINTHCNTIFNGKISATDSDKGVLNYHIISKPHNGNLTLNNDGTFTLIQIKDFLV